MEDFLSYPFDSSVILRKKKLIKKQLLGQDNLIRKKMAILGGSTTSEIKDILELFLLKDKILPEFYESEFNKYYEDVMFDNPKLTKLKPDIIFIHTTSVNIQYSRKYSSDKAYIEHEIEKEFNKFKSIWDAIRQKYACVIIQNNFELPFYRILGNLDSSDLRGKTYFISRLNEEFIKHAQENKNFYINDINYLSSWIGLERWHDKSYWHAFKYALSHEAIPLLSHSVANIIKSIYGKSKKCLVLDLDNTLWGGVVGDDGIENIKIGKETPEAEAYTEFQNYIKELKKRGVILAVCSKNDLKIAKEGLSHPDNILKADDFTVLKANWKRKDENIVDIAKEININLDSMVFVDDNPAEQEIVKSSLKDVSVPSIDNNVVNYINTIDKAGFFETTALSGDDLNRGRYYKDDSKRKETEKSFANYDDFLKSLSMVAEINCFIPLYLERLTQLINKTNQFNLTTKRYTYSEVEKISRSKEHIALYGKLSDKFGDNGIVSIIIGQIRNKQELHLDIWLMSCRVLNRGMEKAMFDALVSECKERKITTIVGYYYKTKRNDIVSQYYQQIGFESVSKDQNGDSVWKYTIPKQDTPQNKNIKIEELNHGKSPDSGSRSGNL